MCEDERQRQPKASRAAWITIRVLAPVPSTEQVQDNPQKDSKRRHYLAASYDSNWYYKTEDRTSTTFK
ncbi:hypothetical protein Pmani_021827 [Petrolisthes manimaculis]|uniref:Uncharacterized protein n=1 Tax=Petrolisthes manimaculis TaxID=1843537 RepID=A0AAE1PF97_9EUCA|nr:hypothetical protein Pmani_021827 [Petrolisthes manimaculis]